MDSSTAGTGEDSFPNDFVPITNDVNSEHTSFGDITFVSTFDSIVPSLDFQSNKDASMPEIHFADDNAFSNSIQTGHISKFEKYNEGQTDLGKQEFSKIDTVNVSKTMTLKNDLRFDSSSVATNSRHQYREMTYPRYDYYYENSTYNSSDYYDYYYENSTVSFVNQDSFNDTIKGPSTNTVSPVINQALPDMHWETKTQDSADLSKGVKHQIHVNGITFFNKDVPNHPPPIFNKANPVSHSKNITFVHDLESTNRNHSGNVRQIHSSQSIATRIENDSFQNGELNTRSVHSVKTKNMFSQSPVASGWNQNFHQEFSTSSVSKGKVVKDETIGATDLPATNRFFEKK